MKNKYLALIMALMMCFSLAFGSLGAVEGSQVTTTEQVSPTRQDTIDKVAGSVNDAYGDQLGEVGEQIKDGVYQGESFMQRIMDILETIKIALSNVMNTIFKKMNIGTGGSIFG